MKKGKFAIHIISALFVFSVSAAHTFAQQPDKLESEKSNPTKIISPSLRDEAKSQQQIKHIDGLKAKSEDPAKEPNNGPTAHLPQKKADEIESSESLEPIIKADDPILVDQIVGIMNLDQIRQRVDNFISELQRNPHATGYIISYGTAVEKAKRRTDINKQFTFRRFPTDHITFSDGGPEIEIRTKFYLVPVGAPLPIP